MTQEAHYNACQKSTNHVVVDAPGCTGGRLDFYSCFECGNDMKRLYNGGIPLSEPVRMTPENILELKVESAKRRSSPAFRK